MEVSMADNGELLKQFESVCNCKHEWKFRTEKDDIRKWRCPKCNGIKTEFVNEDKESIE